MHHHDEMRDEMMNLCRSNLDRDGKCGLGCRSVLVVEFRHSSSSLLLIVDFLSGLLSAC